MKEGTYALVFSADGHTAPGRLSLKNKMLLGTSDGYTLSGQVAVAGNKLIGSVLVLRDAETPTNTAVADKYLVTVHGDAKDESFDLIGTGPLGIIVELNCTWTSEYADGLSKP